MNETGGLITVSEEERARIRAALQAYMRAHRIGVPTLCALVIDRDPRQREMPLSTLQRFLRGKHRTGDAYVTMCAQFLEREGFTPPEVRDPLAALGGAMAGFWSGADIDASVYAPLVGSYLHVEGKDEEQADYELIVSEVPAGRYMVAREQRGGIVPALRYSFEGVLVRAGALILIAMRETLTGLPRSYWLERLSSPPQYRGTYLHGQVTQALFRVEGDNGTCMTSERVMIESGRGVGAVD
ncbi:MAG: hypothetical protein F9K34_09725 [Albidovulum sp.]|uniref:hypothetical protein n=1 Tax=Albidovulum sp. TaxID=1872424 RepID=UPI00132CBEF3|nr:hypothetical protein [Defluviimonas sp.]KAB2884135.1 MAG: hypothetical protein F9K34_09725 [Defluviimonas sp.]